MIEIKIMNYLKEKNIEGIGKNVFIELPLTVPEQYILIQKTSGYISNHIKHATLAIQSVSSTSKLNAAIINETVMDNLIYDMDKKGITQCDLNSTYDFPYTNVKKHRYQAVFNFTYYREV